MLHMHIGMQMPSNRREMLNDARDADLSGGIDKGHKAAPDHMDSGKDVARYG